MAEQLPIVIHPGWWIAASVVCGVAGYSLLGGFTFRIMHRLQFHDNDCVCGYFFWPVLLPGLAGYYWAKACEPKESKEKPCKGD